MQQKWIKIPCYFEKLKHESDLLILTALWSLGKLCKLNILIIISDLGQGPDPVQGAVPGDVIPNLEVDQRAVVVAEVVAGATTKASLNQNQDQDLQSKITHWNCVFESLLNILDNLLTPEGFFSFFEFMLPRTMISWKR